MNVSEKGLAIIENFEGLVLHPYLVGLSMLVIISLSKDMKMGLNS